jgi:hypothetical protein
MRTEEAGRVRTHDHDTASSIPGSAYLNVTTIDAHPSDGFIVIVELYVPTLLTTLSWDATLPTTCWIRFPKPAPTV